MPAVALSRVGARGRVRSGRRESGRRHVAAPGGAACGPARSVIGGKRPLLVGRPTILSAFVRVAAEGRRSMAPRKADPGRQVILHIGLPKTGTTYLQTLFAANRSALAEQGIYYPGEPGEPSQHMAAWDLRGQRARGARDIRQVGQWDALCTAVRSTPLPTALISAELLSALTRRQAACAVNGFPDHDVQVVVTCRDVGRVLVSAWQQGIRCGHTSTWREFVAAVQDPA